MIKKISLIVLFILVSFVAYIAFQPADYTISRSLIIASPAESVFPFLNDPKKMDQWSPWLELDPQVQMTYSGPESGLGAKASWASSGPMGVGSAEIIESLPPQMVKTKLEYLKPFIMSQVAVIEIQSVEGQSKVTWSVQGKNNFMGRLMCFFMDMDKMVGANFEKGLSKLKNLVEKK